MPAIISLTGILIFAHLTCIDTFVVSRYDKATMVKYYYTASKFLATGDIHQPFNHQNLFEFCHQLRQDSIYFDITYDTNVSDTDDSELLSTTYDLTECELLQREVRITHMYERQLDLGNNTYTQLQSFQCFEPNGLLSRVVSPGFVPNTAFLSTYHSKRWPEHQYLTTGRRIYNAKLMAVIDASAVISVTPNFETFMATRRGLQRDPLCNLRKFLKYRLCAAVSVGLGHVDHKYVDHIPYNLYYQPKNDEDSCRYLEGSDLISRRYPKMLYCTVKLTNSRVFKSYYLSLDMLGANNVLFIQQVWNGSQYIRETKYYYVPLLENHQHYVEAFKNVNIG